jgi:transcriptional regulator with XRE-family HTH domain
MPIVIKTPLVAIREKRNISLGQMAQDLNTSRGHLSRVERGERRPNLHLAKSISDYFDGAVTRDQILFPEEYAPRSVRSARLRKAS